MSAYLHRLIARDQAPASTLSPFVRSGSPIAAIDQRLGVIDESLDVDSPSAPPITVPSPASAPDSNATTIQRKAASPIAASPASLASPASPAPPSSLASPPSPASPTIASPSPRALQLDPGPLFDLAPSPRQFDETRIHEIVRESTTTTTTTAAPLVPESRVAPRLEPRIRPSPTPVEARIAPSPAIESPTRPTLEPRTSPIPPQAFAPTPSPAPWRTFEPLAPISEPRLEPARPSPLTLASTPARLEPSPSAHPPIAVHPSELPTTDSVQVQPPRSVQVRIGQVDIEIIPSSPPAHSTPQRAARPTLDSISQIGSLDRHFPNRRRLRLRYR